jgi:hypothetical protein
LAELPADQVAIVLTTWAFAYFEAQDRVEFMELLDRASHHRDVAWLSAEAAGIVEPLAGARAPDDEQGTSDILGAVLFRGGARRATPLGYVQEHGAWLDWRAT